MIRQKPNKKVTALNKKRVNLFRLQQRVERLEKQGLVQAHFNQQLTVLREVEAITAEEIEKRVSELERIVLPEKQGAVQKCGVFKRSLNRLWRWING